jgi:murein DD-endopeptidase MepM/ murein hydrolase activator NlpD
VTAGKWGGRLLANRQLLLRTNDHVRSIALPAWLQAVGLIGAVAFIGVTSYFAAGYFHAHRVIHSRDISVALAAAAKADGEATIGQLRGRIKTLRTELATDRFDLSDALEKLATAQAETLDVRGKLDAANLQLASVTTQFSSVSAQLAVATAQSAKLKSELVQFKAEAAQREQTAAAALSARNEDVARLTKALDVGHDELSRAEAQRASLQKRIQQLEQKLEAAEAQAEQRRRLAAIGDALQNLQKVHGDETPGHPNEIAVATAPQSAAKPEKSAPHPKGEARAGVGSELERALAATGLDIDRLISGLAPLPGREGGPYVALDSGKHPAEVDPRRLEELRKLAKTLPLGVPLAQYQIESPFGPRRDPINRRASFHDGIDMSAAYRSPVYSTGPGVVSFAGSMGDFGRVVEIDHGHGIVSRYAHLHRVLVSRGETVGGHRLIGELGSTGRATGPHVHYEILIDGNPVDPAKFMEAGKNVVQVGND